MALFLLSAALPGRGRLLRPRRDFKPCVSVWNTTSAAQHEMDFMRCVTGEEGPPPQLRSALARELLPNASQPVSTVASNLMRDDATSFCDCTLELHDAASCGHASAQAVLDEYEPWCLFLGACPAIARALLHSAQACREAGFRAANWSEPLCEAAGANECAFSVQKLFESTHAAHRWANASDADAERRAVERSQYAQLQQKWGIFYHMVPPWMAPASFEGTFGQLSSCMASVRVEEAQLNLPLSLGALSGNHSWHRYDRFFRSKCGVEYQLWDELVEQAMSLSGGYYAEDQWAAGNKAVALSILAANVAMVLLACGILLRFVQRGHCYRLCSPSSAEERAGLKGGEEARGGSQGGVQFTIEPEEAHL